ncbi:tyrosine-type recombinase/integrase [Nocardioides panacisoli]|uniref:Site-specific integrase n=1 Tax=Nocardioides panacisoli TaxID=627624 RepID=A0ABP7I412_9ACTN
MSGRPRTPIGTYGAVHVAHHGRRRYTAKTRFRDLDGVLRQVKATGASRGGAVTLLKIRLADRPGYGRDGQLGLSSPFADLCELWLSDLAAREVTEGTKDNYRDDLRLHVRPFFESYTLGEITTGRVEVFLKQQAAVSYSRAKHTRTLLNQLFGYALRHDAISRNPVEGTSPLNRTKGAPQALTMDQIAAIRLAAQRWRTGPGVMGPKPDGQVRDAIEVLLGTGMRPGEVLALRPVDITHTRTGMVANVTGTVVAQKGRGTFRQPRPKTDASARSIPVPEFAAVVIRRRLKLMGAEQREVTIFHNRAGGPLTLHNLRRTFREFLVLAGLEDSGITPRWFRRTGATVLARGLGADVAASYLGHTSTAITEGHYIEPDRRIDFEPASVIERTLRPIDPDGSLLSRPIDEQEEDLLDLLDAAQDDDAA